MQYCNTGFINQIILTSITSFKFGVSETNPPLQKFATWQKPYWQKPLKLLSFWLDTIKIKMSSFPIPHAAMCQVFRSLSWYRAYTNSKWCTLYFFLYHDDFYAPLQIKSLSGHIHIYKMDRQTAAWSAYAIQKLLLVGYCNYKLRNVQIFKHDVPVAMPVTVTVPLTH